MSKLFTVALATAMLAAAIAGCSADSDEGGGSGSGSSGGDLTFTSWGGVYQDAQVKAFIKPFEQDTGTKVTDDPGMSYAKVKTMVDTDNVSWDVVTAEGFWAVQECEQLLEPLDKQVDLSQIDPELVQSECGAPLLTYLSAVYYNTETFSGNDHPTGCKDFFDTERFPGKRAAYGVAVPNALIECALLADGVAPNELYPLDLDRAFAKIESIKDDLVFWNIGADSEQLMTSGEVAMLLAFNGRAYAAIAQQGAKFAPAYGESLLHEDVLVVPKGAKDPEQAKKLVSSMMDPERQAELTRLIPYGPSNEDAKLSGLSPDLKEYLPTTNPKLAKGVVVQDQRWWAEHADEVTQRWEETFQG
jgi:putative spermidine/putrescine transport system substrate-binding protein